jgi:hypothetical protein
MFAEMTVNFDKKYSNLYRKKAQNKTVLFPRKLDHNRLYLIVTVNHKSLILLILVSLGMDRLFRDVWNSWFTSHRRQIKATK